MPNSTKKKRTSRSLSKNGKQNGGEETTSNPKSKTNTSTQKNHNSVSPTTPQLEREPSRRVEDTRTRTTTSTSPRKALQDRRPTAVRRPSEATTGPNHRVSSLESSSPFSPQQKKKKRSGSQHSPNRERSSSSRKGTLKCEEPPLESPSHRNKNKSAKSGSPSSPSKGKPTPVTSTASEETKGTPNEAISKAWPEILSPPPPTLTTNPMTVFRPIPIERDTLSPQISVDMGTGAAYSALNLTAQVRSGTPTVGSGAAAQGGAENKREAEETEQHVRTNSIPTPPIAPSKGKEVLSSSSSLPLPTEKEALHSSGFTDKSRTVVGDNEGVVKNGDGAPHLNINTIDANRFSVGVENHKNHAYYQQKLAEEARNNLTLPMLEERLQALKQYVEVNLVQRIRQNETILDADIKNTQELRDLLIHQTNTLIALHQRGTRRTMQSRPAPRKEEGGEESQEAAAAAVFISYGELMEFEKRVTQLVVKGRPSEGASYGGFRASTKEREKEDSHLDRNDKDGEGGELERDNQVLLRGILTFSQLELFATVVEHNRRINNHVNSETLVPPTPSSTAFPMGREVRVKNSAILARWKAWKRVFPLGEDYYIVRQWLEKKEEDASLDKEEEDAEMNGGGDTLKRTTEIKLLRISGFIRKVQKMTDEDVLRLLL